MEFLSNRSITKFDLFKRAVHTERDLLKENVGIQDQIHAAFGGLNLYQFHKDDLTIRPAQMATECRVEALDRSLCLVYTGIQRHASTTVQEQLKNTQERKLINIFLALLSSVTKVSVYWKDPAPKHYASRSRETGQRRMGSEAEILHFRLFAADRRSLRRRDASRAYGGKLCGAGGGGFLLFMASDDVQSKMIETFGQRAS